MTATVKSVIATWAELKQVIFENLVKFLGANEVDQKVYANRLDFELNEIDKQGANGYWIRAYNADKKFDHNKPGLVIAFILGLTPIDPIKENIPHNVKYQPDYPDIDIDFLPIARNFVKAYAEQQYGSEHICSVGAWLTYKPKLALQDAISVLPNPDPRSAKNAVMELTKNLPDDFDDQSYEDAYKEHATFRAFADEHPEIVKLAYRMVGKIKAQSRHAGGFVISSVPIRDFIPLTLCGSEGEKQWTSAWTEGMKATQLSKFGFVKFDVLGLATMLFIWEACKLITSNRGVVIDWQDMDWEDDRAGWETNAEGVHTKIRFSDEPSLQAADELKVDTIFQFETDFMKSVLQKGGVKSFMDLVVYNALGRPGPLPMLDVYVANRDSDGAWKDAMHPAIAELLYDTYGVITFQEQLAKFWVEICGFTVPEAEAARKAVAKKKQDVLDQIRPQFVRGATETLGADAADKWWEDTISFGRYAFNKSHAAAYTVISFRCLYLKTHYPAEWWAAVMSDCHRDKMIKYMGVARLEGTKFSSVNANHLTEKFTVKGDEVLPGLTSIKGMGGSACAKLVGGGPYASIEDFIAKVGSSKTILERLIKLGGFDTIHPNRRALWHWYQYQYGSDYEAKRIVAQVNYCLAWPVKAVHTERERQVAEFRAAYPKRKAIPAKLANWVPTLSWNEPRPYEFTELNEAEAEDEKKTKTPVNTLPEDAPALMQYTKKLAPTFSDIIALITKDFETADHLAFEKEYLGYFWTSPLELFVYDPEATIEGAKLHHTLNAVIQSAEKCESKNGSEYKKLVVTDGTQTAKVMVWANEVRESDEEVWTPGTGVNMIVDWNDKYKSFNVQRRQQVTPLARKSAVQAVQPEVSSCGTCGVPDGAQHQDNCMETQEAESMTGQQSEDANAISE